MKYLKVILLLILITTLSFSNDKQIEDIFKKNNLNGTIVISTLDNKTTYTYNKQRANRGYLPASTFKIPNTMIALEEKAIQDDKEIIKWDGKKRFYEPWNKDHTLQSALQYSCVWCYQKLAKKIGNKNYLKYLEKINYGNKKTGKELTTFWLEGDIRISAKEQIAFLKKLYNNDLPFNQNYINITKKILTVKATDTYTIKAKTGWSDTPIYGVGWYVGYVKKKNSVYFFALNIDIENKSQLKYRTQIVNEVLKLKGIID